jgi:hypothetical protein
MIKKLILDKVRWLRGGHENTLLLNWQGGMCCLGFCMAQEGATAEQLLGLGEPDEVYGRTDTSGKQVLGVIDYLVKDAGEDDGDPRYYNTRLTTEAISINDDEETTDQEKVSMLNKLFLEEGIEVVLVDTPEEAETLSGLPVGFGVKK